MPMAKIPPSRYTDSTGIPATSAERSAQINDHPGAAVWHDDLYSEWFDSDGVPVE